MADSAFGGSTRLIGGISPRDAVLSPDGETLYVADAAGNVTVITVDTGAVVTTWDIGDSLDGISISSDGMYLSLAELNPVGTAEDELGDMVPIVAAYRVNTATGATDSYELTAGYYDYTFADTAYLADGSILLTQHFNGSGWITLRTLDPETGTFTDTGMQVRHNSTITVSDDYSTALIGEADISNAPMLRYDLTQMDSPVLVAQSDVYNFNTSGFNSGVQALSSDGALAAQWIFYSGLYILDEDMQLVANVFDTVPTLRDDAITGATFSQDGDYLYLLSVDARAVIQISTASWTEVSRLNLPGDVSFNAPTAYGQFTNNLLATDDGDWLIVALGDGLLRVDTGRVDGTPSDDLLRAAPEGMEIYGHAGNDILLGSAGNDDLTGGPGFDRIFGGGGSTDRVIYSGNFSDYQFSLGASGTGLIVTDMRANGDGNDYLYDVDRLIFADSQMWYSDVIGTLEQPDFHATLITTPGFKGEISGQVNVFGTAGFEFITVGSAFPFHNSYVVFDPSFSGGNNVIELDPGHYTVALSGSNAVFASMASIGPTVVIPVGIEGVPIKMGENVWSLYYDQTTQSAYIGDTPFGSEPVFFTGELNPGSVSDDSDMDAIARVLLVPGAEFSADGIYEVFGTFAPETVLVGEGSFVFDPSFNSGGDTIRLPGSAADYTAVQSGSGFLIESDTTSILLPAGPLPTTLSFNGTEVQAFYDPGFGLLFIGNVEVGFAEVNLAMIA